MVLQSFRGCRTTKREGEQFDARNMWSEKSPSYRRPRSCWEPVKTQFSDRRIFQFFFSEILSGCTLCVLFLIVLFSISSQQLFQVAANDCTAGIAATHHVLAHAFKDSWAVPNTFTC